MRAGFELLLGTQERYVDDDPVGRLKDEDLAGWQADERKRLEKIRKKKKAKSEWPYEGVYRVRGGVIPAGYRVGGTAIVCDALVSSPDYVDNDAAHDAVKRAVKFMVKELKKNKQLEAGPKRGYDVRGWAHCYALRFFLRALRQELVEGSLAKSVEKMVPHLIDCLATNEVKREGGWNYARDTSISPFMTGSTLITLYRAKAQGFEVDEGLVTRALDGLAAARVESGSYTYSGAQRDDVPFPGASARASIAELSLFLAGRSDADKLRVAVDAFFAHWNELMKRKSQQGTHVGKYGIAPYYFMYGHTYAAMAIEALPEADRPELRKKMQATLWNTREEGGGWNDRIFPRSESYSTAMAMLALMAPQLEPIPTWE